MPYRSLKGTEESLETLTPEQREIETIEGSNTDIETGHFVDGDELSSFLGRKLKDGEGHPQMALTQQDSSAPTPLVTTLIPWIVNSILTVALISLS